MAQLPTEQRTNGDLIRDAFAPISEKLTELSVAFYDGQVNKGRTHVFLGTVVSADGLVLCKSSTYTDEGDYSVRIGSQKYQDVTLVNRSEKWDLALVKVALPEGETLQVPEWAKTIDLPEGIWVAQTGKLTRRKRYARVGVLSGKRREIGPAPATIGVTLDETENALVIKGLAEEGPAAKAGLQEGDVLLQLNGEKIKSSIDLYEKMQEIDPGSTVKLLYSRDGEEIELEIEVASRTEVYGIEMTRNDGMSGRFSFRREDFPVVIQYDVHASPRSVGGPVLDLQGRCLGVTIARVDRVTTFAIPAEEIPGIVEMLRDGKGDD